MKAQFSLTVEEGKKLIAKGVAELEEVKVSIEEGIILKGGTTLSAVSRELGGPPMRVCGRITERGTVGPKVFAGGAHTLLLKGGKFTSLDSELDDTQVIPKLVICSGNIMDNYGNAAMMIGSSEGGAAGRALKRWSDIGVNFLIPMGIEKLVPGRIPPGYDKRGSKDISYGMSVGLLPLRGRVFTEADAVEALAGVECDVIGAGGITGAEGGVTLNISGDARDVERVLGAVEEVKAGGGIEYSSREECTRGNPRCGEHLSCGYLKGDIKERRKNKIGFITIGQSPRSDITRDIEGALSSEVIMTERGALDIFHDDTVFERVRPKAGEETLVSRLRDGREIKIGEKSLDPLIQEAISHLEESVEGIVLLCTGKFPAFESRVPLVRPNRLIKRFVSGLVQGEKLGVIVPKEEQREKLRRSWEELGVETEVWCASPYEEMEGIIEAGKEIKKSQCRYIFLDCMGYSSEMKEKLEQITNKKILLPRTILGKLVSEVF